MNTFIIDALAVYRLTRLATRDAITEQIREVIASELDTAQTSGLISKSTREKIDYLMSCDWCMSIWIAAGVVALKKYVPDVWNNLRYVLATSAVTGLIASNE